MAWTFHTEKRGTLTVMVLPRTSWRGVKDSNVAIVKECEHRPSSMKPNENGVEMCSECGAIPGAVLVTKGQKPNCDLKALASIVGYSVACQILDGEHKVETVEDLA
jgi:hypothetical protein